MQQHFGTPDKAVLHPFYRVRNQVRPSSSPASMKCTLWIKPGAECSAGLHARAGSNLKHRILQASNLVSSSFPFTGALPSMWFHRLLICICNFRLLKYFLFVFCSRQLPLLFVFSIGTGHSLLGASDEFSIFHWLDVSVILLKLASFFLCLGNAGLPQ